MTEKTPVKPTVQTPPAENQPQSAAAPQKQAVETLPKPFKEPLPQTDEEITATIRAYLKDKDLSKLPASSVSQAIFPGEQMSSRFERLFRAVISPPKKDESDKG